MTSTTYEVTITEVEQGPDATVHDTKTIEEWRLLGELSRANGPARQEWNADGALLSYEYAVGNDIGHREDGPVFWTRNPITNIVTLEAWMLEDRRHREDGPAYLERDRHTGIAVVEQWYLHGELHRTNGPAVILRDVRTGEILEAQHYENGCQIVSKPQETPYKFPEPD